MICATCKADSQTGKSYEYILGKLENSATQSTGAGYITQKKYGNFRTETIWICEKCIREYTMNNMKEHNWWGILLFAFAPLILFLFSPGYAIIITLIDWGFVLFGLGSALYYLLLYFFKAPLNAFPEPINNISVAITRLSGDATHYWDRKNFDKWQSGKEFSTRTINKSAWF